MESIKHNKESGAWNWSWITNRAEDEIDHEQRAGWRMELTMRKAAWRAGCIMKGRGQIDQELSHQGKRWNWSCTASSEENGIGREHPTGLRMEQVEDGLDHWHSLGKGWHWSCTTSRLEDYNDPLLRAGRRLQFILNNQQRKDGRNHAQSAW